MRRYHATDSMHSVESGSRRACDDAYGAEASTFAELALVPRAGEPCFHHDQCPLAVETPAHRGKIYYVAKKIALGDTRVADHEMIALVDDVGNIDFDVWNLAWSRLLGQAYRAAIQGAHLLESRCMDP